MSSLRLVHNNASVDRSTGPFDAELQALLEHGKIIVPLPGVVRARALARARAALADAAAPSTSGALRRLRRC